MILGQATRIAALLLISMPMVVGPIQAQTPDGRTFRVNTATATQQAGPIVGMDGAGRAVILWTDLNMDPSRLIHPRIAGQRFDPQGRRNASEFVCNEPPFQANGLNGLVLQGGAEFVSLWSERAGYQYLARHYDASGIPSGKPLVLDDEGPQIDHFDDLVAYGTRTGGEFVGVWQRVAAESSEYLGTFARWFDRNAQPLTDEIPLPDAFLEDGSPIGRPLADVLAGPDRSVVIGWTIPGFNEAYWDLHIQGFSAAGEKLGPEFLVSHNIGRPEAGMAWNSATRNFVVAWRSAERILFQRLSLQGQPLAEEPTVISETGGIPAAVACNNKGFCAVTWFREQVGIVLRIVRPDGTVSPAEVLVARVPAYPNWIAYGGNGALMVVWTDDYSSTSDPADIAARRLIASPGDEVCQRVSNEVRCDSGRTGSLPELRLASFGLDRRDKLLFGDVDGDGRAEPCRVRGGVWRCDTDHEGGAAETALGFNGAASGTPLMGDLDGDGRAEACVWSAGILRCDTAHNNGSPELSLIYGRKGEMPLLGDLDGDGRDDLCLASRGSLRCDVAHDGGRKETRFAFGQPGDLFVLGDFDGNGTDDPCLVRAGKLLCDTAHDGGEAEIELLLGSPGTSVVLGNLDGV